MTLKTVEICYVTANSQDDTYVAQDAECDRLAISFLTSSGHLDRNVSLYRIIYPVTGAPFKSTRESSEATHNADVYHPERIELVKTLAKDAVMGSINHDNLSKIIRIFISIHDLGFEVDLTNKESCQSFYKVYTDYLFSQLRQSKIKGKGFKRSTASSYQHALAVALSRAFSDSIDTWKGSYFRISNKDSNEPLPTLTRNKKEFQQAYAFFRRYFEETTKYLLSECDKPLYIPFEDLGLTDLVYVSGQNHSWKGFKRGDTGYLYSFVYDKDGIHGWDETRRRIENAGIEMTEEEQRQVRHYIYGFNQLGLLDREKTRRSLANNAVFAFVKILLAETGANPKHIENLDLSTERLETELGHVRLLAQKGRAGYETQPIRMPVSFLSVWRQYLELRGWMLKHAANGDDPKVGLLAYNLNAKSQLVLVKALDIGQKRRYVRPDELPYIPAKEWRKFKSQELTNAADGEIKVSADLLNQSEPTARKHYSHAKFETAAVELQQFFTELKNHSALIVRDQNGLPPVVEDAPAIKTGRCTGTTVNDAKKIAGMDERAPEPRCGTPIHCFFCESFGIHKEVGDFKKLLAAKKWVEYQARTKTEGIEEAMKKYAPITQRIDAILDEFIEMAPEHADLLSQAQQEVQAGNIDVYWLNKLNAVIEAMEY